MSTKQIAALQYIAANPGCCAADVTRYEWSGRGHNASYARVDRLRARRLVRGARVGARIELTVTDLGASILAARS